MDQDQINHMTGAIMGMMGFFMLFFFALTGFFIFLYWRIFTRAGLAGPLSLLFLVPGIGWLIVPCVLAFAEWRVVPAPSPYGGLQPYPPPPTNYPPAPTSYTPPPPPQP